MLLQIIWFVLIGVLLAGYAVLDGFDLGVGALYPFLGKTDEEKAALRNSIGPVWDGNEVWLLTGGGALFAAFPAVYATVFSGFYLALMLVLFSLIFRAVSIEYRGHDEAWGGLWDWGFFLGSALPALLYGVAVGNIALGVPLTGGTPQQVEFAGNFFTLLGFWNGGFNPAPLTVGLLGLSMFLLQGASWAALKTEGDLQARAVAFRGKLMWVFAGLAVLTTFVVAFFAGSSFGGVIHSPFGWLFVVLLVLSIVWAYLADNGGKDLQAWYAASLAAVSLTGLWAAGIFPNLVPDIDAPAAAVTGAATKALTVYNASSSQLTLTVMLIIAVIGVPLVLFYVGLVYKTFAGKVKAGGY